MTKQYQGNKTVSEQGGTFMHPEQLPESNDEHQNWQQANQQFWEEHSMRYDWDTQIEHAEFSAEFYREIDSRFLSAVKEIMPWKNLPFEKWIDFNTLHDKDILEIGVGNGTHAQLLASHTKSFTGIDLTEYAQKSTSTRLKVFGVAGAIYQMDAERLGFPDASFDFVWSWGVIHHSSDTQAILKEIHRVLKPNGTVVVMVYYRSFWSYYVAGWLLGLSKGVLWKGKSIHQINQSRTDGALARYYTLNSWRKMVQSHFEILRLETLGNKGDLLPIPGSKLKQQLLHLLPASMTEFMLNKLRMGSFLICEMKKK